MKASLAVLLAAAPALAQDLPAEVLADRVVDETLFGELDDFDRFGAAITVLGDLDGDGHDDLAVGAPGRDDGGPNRGAVHVLFLDGEGEVTATSTISSTSGDFTGDLDDGDRFGCGLAALGDLDGDGVADLAVGAPYDDDGGVPPDANVGAVWILFLRPDGGVAGHRKISAADGPLAGQLDVSDRFAVALAPVGDLDGDGVVDLAAGAPLDDDGATNRGAVWTLFLGPNGALEAATKISSTSGGFAGALEAFDEFGSAVAGLGDLDGDGATELAVGAPGADVGGFDRGTVWILSLLPDGTTAGQIPINAAVGGFGGSIASFDRLGASLARLGDHNADAVCDLAVGAPGDDDGGGDTGAVWVIFLRENGTARHERKLSKATGGLGDGVTPGDAFGTAVALFGDRNGDGIDDLLVGAPGDTATPGGNDRGAVHLLDLTDHAAAFGGGVAPRWTSAPGGGAGGGEPVPGFSDAPSGLEPGGEVGARGGLPIPRLGVEAETLLPGDEIELGLRSPLPGALVALTFGLVDPGGDVVLEDGLFAGATGSLLLAPTGPQGAFATTIALGDLDGEPDPATAAADARLVLQLALLDPDTMAPLAASDVEALTMPGP